MLAILSLFMCIFILNFTLPGNFLYLHNTLEILCLLLMCIFQLASSSLSFTLKPNLILKLSEYGSKDYSVYLYIIGEITFSLVNHFCH